MIFSLRWFLLLSSMAKHMSPWLSRACTDWQPLSSSPSSPETPHWDSNADNLIVPELWAVCLLRFQPNEGYETSLPRNTDTPGAHLAQTTCFFALRGGAVEFGSSVCHPSPLGSSCFCNQEMDILNSHDCFCFSFKSLCLVSALTHSYYSPPQIWLIYLLGKQLRKQDKSKPCINFLAEIIIWFKRNQKEI